MVSRATAFIAELNPAYGGTSAARSVQIPLEAGRGGAYQQNRTPYQRMKRAGIPSKIAQAACFRTACPGLPVGPARARVRILDDPKFKNLNFILPQSVSQVCKLDSTIGLPS